MASKGEWSARSEYDWSPVVSRLQSVYGLHFTCHCCYHLRSATCNLTMRETFEEILSELYGEDPVPAPASIEFTVNFPEVSSGLIPGRGFLGSLVFYAIVIPALIYLPARTFSHHEPVEQWQVTMLPRDAIYLPRLGGGSAGGVTASKPGESRETARSSSMAANSKAGVSYPGAQPIVSNPPNPTNRVQTILQPAIENPQTLKTFVPLPNIVKMAIPSPPQLLAGPLKTLEPEPEPLEKPEDQIPRVKASVQMSILSAGLSAPVDNPKLAVPAPVLPATTNTPLERLQAPLVPPAPPAETKPVPTKPHVLSGVRGQFAVTIQPLLALSNLGPGSETANAGASSVAVGKNLGATVRNAAGGESESTGAATKPTPGAGMTGASSKPDGGAAVPGNSTGSGGSAAGNSSGEGAGSGFGISIASGSGAGAGAGSGAFPGITIQGGEQRGGEVAFKADGQTGAAEEVKYGSYGMTIVSNGNSGGGLKDFGVFTGEQVFTVYIGMNASPSDPAPSWTMEYARMRGSGDPQGTLAAPFPLRKESPHWPAELSARYRGQLIVVYAVISREGTLLNMRIMQTPNVKLNAELFKALHQWSFRPARMNGNPVAVEVLFGVPL